MSAAGTMAFAQTPAAQTASPPPAADTRPATTTIDGDTGLWFVPTGEVLPAKKWSVSAYRVNFDRDQGFTDVSDWPVTFGFGAGDRAEIFGAWTLVRRIDRDVRPLFISTQPVAGRAGERGAVRAPGLVGQSARRLLGRREVQPDVAVEAAAGGASPCAAMIKLPTASTDNEGVGTGKVDFAIDGIVSKEVNQRVEVSGFGGFIVRGDPDDIDLANGFRWGFGAGVPSRKGLRFTGELHGESYLSDSITISSPMATPLIAEDGTAPPSVTDLKSPVNATLGLTWQGKNGLFAGGGINWNLHMSGRTSFLSGVEDVTGDAAGWQFRIGYHPGVRVYVAPPPPPPPPPPPAPAPQHNLTVPRAVRPVHGGSRAGRRR